MLAKSLAVFAVVSRVLAIVHAICFFVFLAKAAIFFESVHKKLDHLAHPAVVVPVHPNNHPRWARDAADAEALQSPAGSTSAEGLSEAAQGIERPDSQSGEAAAPLPPVPVATPLPPTSAGK